MEKTRKTTEQEKEVMEFLNLLRNTGETNMYGATPYIQAEFGLDRSESQRILTLWMQNFNASGIYEEVKA